MQTCVHTVAVRSSAGLTPVAAALFSAISLFPTSLSVVALSAETLRFELQQLHPGAAERFVI